MNPYHETDLPQDILDLLVEYYNNLYNDDRFIAISSVMSPNNDIVVNYKIKQCDRLRIGADIYGSVQAARHEKSAYILARFVQHDGTIDTYPGQVQFFFEHTIYKSQELVHSLALVRWYEPVQDHKTRYHCQVDEEDINSCNIVELWSNEFYYTSRDSIVPIHNNILGKFIKCKFYVGIRKPKEYMAVVALNKKISF